MDDLHRIKQVITAYEEDSRVRTWHDQVRKIDDLYRATNSDMMTQYMPKKSKPTFNILWANIQTMLPAVYSRNPKPDVSRRFNASDPVAREASGVLERCLKYATDTDEFMQSMRYCAFDWLLFGRGTAWIRYEPTIRTKETQLENDYSELGENEQVEHEEELYFEEVKADFVQCLDFGHNIAPTWREVYMVWRKVRMTKKAVSERFGKEKADKLSYSQKNTNSQEDNGITAEITINVNLEGTATIYELWDKSANKVYFLTKECQEFLDEQDDPLQLKEFFPCPRPLFANITSNSIIVTPDFHLYETQADQLNLLSQKIGNIQNSLAVRGVYDAAAVGLDKMLGVENKLIPINMQDYGVRGGLQEMIQFFPLEQISKALEYLYQAFDETKRQLYEISGISDILRGEGDAQETATGVRTKGQYALLRLEDKQKEIQRFVRDVMRIFGEIISEKFSPDIVHKIGGEQLLTMQEKMMLQQGQVPPRLQYYRQDEIETMMAKPDFDSVIALLQDDPARCMRVDIETDSTIKQDQIQDRADRVEFLKAVSTYLKDVLPAAEQDPTLVPVLGQLFMYGVRGYQVGKDTEQFLSDWVQKAIQTSANPQPKPDPKTQELQAKMQLEQQKLQMQNQFDQQKMQAQMQIEQQMAQFKMQLERERLQQQAQLEQIKLQSDKERQIAEAQADVYTAQQTQAAQSADSEKQMHLEHQFNMQELAANVAMEDKKLEFEKWRVLTDNENDLKLAKMNKVNKKEPNE